MFLDLCKILPIAHIFHGTPDRITLFRRFMSTQRPLVSLVARLDDQVLDPGWRYDRKSIFRVVLMIGNLGM